MKYIRFEEEDFKKLVNGEILEFDNVRICLADIGFNQMFRILFKVAYEDIDE